MYNKWELHILKIKFENLIIHKQIFFSNQQISLKKYISINLKPKVLIRILKLQSVICYCLLSKIA